MKRRGRAPVVRQNQKAKNKSKCQGTNTILAMVLAVVTLCTISNRTLYQKLISFDTTQPFQRPDHPQDANQHHPQLQTAGSTSTSPANNNKHKIFRYDEAGVQPAAMKTTTGTRRIIRSHRLPNAVPVENSIPLDQIHNKSYHVSQRTNTSTVSVIKPHKVHGHFDWKNHDYARDYRTLYYYNPSILPLYKLETTTTTTTKATPNSSNDRKYESILPFEAEQALTGGDVQVKYLVVYQTYLGCNCFGRDPHREIMRAGEQLSYVAMALLDEDLKLIKDTDILIDLNAGPGFGKYFRQFRGDCRLSGMKGSIYLLCNDHLHRIQVVRTNQSQGRQPPPHDHYATRDDHTKPYLYPNIHGNGLQVILHNDYYSMGGGKNFNFLQSQQEGGSGNAEYFLQLYPIPHQYRRVALPDYDDTKLRPYPPNWEPDHTSTAPIPRDSFETIDALHPIQICNDTSKEEEMANKEDNSSHSNCTNPVDVPFWKMHNDHGTACCVAIDLPVSSLAKQQDGTATTISVLVGISHNKLNNRDKFWLDDLQRRYDQLPKNQYVSRFVAYRSTPPFDIVAVSGYFCLGYHNDDINDDTDVAVLARKSKAQTTTNPLRPRLTLFNETFACPPIHFPSTFTEYIGDPTKAIIGYGVNDCFPILMVVSKQDVINRLLGTGL